MIYYVVGVCITIWVSCDFFIKLGTQLVCTSVHKTTNSKRKEYCKYVNYALGNYNKNIEYRIIKSE